MKRSNSKCYQMLGLTGNESIDQVRRAYRRLARRLHPDLVGGDASQFKEITAAYNQLIQALKDASGVRNSSPNSPRRSRRKQSESRRTSHDGARRTSGPEDAWTPWSPTDQKSADNTAEAADWSTFEKVYREQMKNRARRTRRDVPHSARQARSSEVVENEHSGTKGEDAFAPQPPSSDHDVQPNDRPSGHQHPRVPRDSQPPRSEGIMDEDFSAAWAAWCESARRFEARHGWREVRTDLPRGSHEESTSAASETDSDTGFRSWFKRGLDKLKVTRKVMAEGRDKHLRLPVNASVILHGGRQRLAITRDALCPSCQGAPKPECVCMGEGRVALREEVNVDIPAGVHFGAQLRLQGKGTEGLPGHRDGDLYLHLEPREIDGFRRDGLDLHGSCSVTPELARNGGDVVVELPRGRVKVKVPPRTCVGDRFRLKGQGVPAYLGHDVGDVYLSVKVEK